MDPEDGEYNGEIEETSTARKLKRPTSVFICWPAETDTASCLPTPYPTLQSTEESDIQIAALHEVEETRACRVIDDWPKPEPDTETAGKPEVGTN